MSDGQDHEIIDKHKRHNIGLGLKSLMGLVAAPLISFGANAETAQAHKRPKPRLKTSCAWILGQDEFLDDSHIGEDDPAKVNRELDKAFFTASVSKKFTHYAVLRLLEDKKIQPDMELVMSQYALSRSTNGIFTNNLMRDNYIIIDGKRRDTIQIHEALPWSGGFSANDAHIAIAERIALGRTVPKNISVGASRRLELAFIREYLEPIFEELGMTNTRIRMSTGLPFNSAKGDPADYENYTTHRDLMKFTNAFYRDFPEAMDMYAQTETRIHRVFKDPKTNKWKERSKRLANDSPNLEHSSEINDEDVTAIPVPNVDLGKSGLNKYCLWEALQSYNAEKDGKRGRIMIFTNGDTNDTYASNPKQVVENAVALALPQMKPILKETPTSQKYDDGPLGPYEPYPQA